MAGNLNRMASGWNLYVHIKRRECRRAKQFWNKILVYNDITPKDTGNMLEGKTEPFKSHILIGKAGGL
ncbi:uncharacterized protein CIMG_12849 [Coccidioides immitis RS]|uniref:Uncharacterized protein n=1 Tax=Coccidioides immitis (strain RS) TaxID=246410 RepID=A0A0D8JTI8_COCIM|nr:uncharacterized protein CIMG_12849 [Coccidioides immitis RS]KJF60276.1 hypothetical protein CIMG_12849 [Coccidioides immitis RS]